MGLLEGMIVCRLWLSNLFFLVILCVMGCSPKTNEDELPFYNTAEFDAEWIDSYNAAYKQIHTIESFSFQNQSGNVITNDSLKGHIYVANFFFTSCPSVCPKMTNNLLELQQTFLVNDKVKLISFSVMPWVDSVSVLQEYAQKNNIDVNKWHLLTGNKDEIYDLGRKSFFVEKGLGLQKSNDEFLHTESLVLIDTKGRIRGIYNATQKTDIGRVTEDIKTLLKES